MKVPMLDLLDTDVLYCVEIHRLVNGFNRITFVQEL